MAGELILATRQGIVVCEKKGPEWRVIRRGLESESATSVIAREEVILAGTRRGVFRSDDLGQTWRPAQGGMGDRIVRWLAFHPDISDFELAGLEPADIFISRDGANSWYANPAVAQMRSLHHWYLPYSPEAGCVRGFAVNGTRIYAAVEVGGVLRSDDSGASWELVNGEDNGGRAAVHPDVHSLVVQQAEADRVYAPTGGGFYVSVDGGKSWRNLVSRCYCRAMWLDQLNPKRMLLGIADGVDRNGRIDLSEDGGLTWQPASSGLDVPWPNHMVERFTQAGEGLLAVLSNGEMIQAEIAATPHAWRWTPVLNEVKGIQAVTQMI